MLADTLAEALSHFLSVTLRYIRKQVPHEVHPAPLPACPGHHLLNRHHQGHGDYPPVLPQFHYLGVQPLNRPGIAGGLSS